MRDLRRPSMGGTRALQHRRGMLVPAGHGPRALRRSIGRRIRRHGAYTFWDLQQQANRLANALAALGIGRGDKVRADPAAAAETSSRTWRSISSAPSRCRYRSCSGPRRLPTGSPIRRPSSRSSIRNRCRISPRRGWTSRASRKASGCRPRANPFWSRSRAPGEGQHAVRAGGDPADRSRAC